MERSILVLHGPNLNMLGRREVSIYGNLTLDDINEQLNIISKKRNFELYTLQSNHEGVIVDKIHSTHGIVSGILINPAAYTHTSVAIRDAILAVDVPVVEVHLSNIYKREPFRHKSYISDVAIGVVSGFGPHSYYMGLEALINHLDNTNNIV